MKVTVLIENTSLNSSLKVEHGLSFYIQHDGKNYLLDSGSTKAFMDNAKILNVDLNQVDYTILSHGHYDHSGGFINYLKEYKNKSIYASSKVFDAYFSKARGTLHEIGVQKDLFSLKERFIFLDKHKMIEKDVHLIFASTDQSHHYAKKAKLYNKKMEYDDFCHEISLVFDTNKGLVIFNSCSHGGPIEIVERVKQLLPHRPLYAYIGGLHMKGQIDGQEICTYTNDELEKLCELFKNTYVYVGHCTGDISYHLLENRLKNKIKRLTTGLTFNLD